MPYGCSLIISGYYMYGFFCIHHVRVVHSSGYTGCSGGSRISRFGAQLVKGVSTPDAATFRKIYMSKRKNRHPRSATGLDNAA